MRCSLIILLCIIYSTGYGQRTHIMLGVGSGFSFVSKKHINGHYKPITGINAGLSLLVPLGSRFVFETGLGYEKRGFRADSSFTDRWYKDEFSAREIHHYITIPLQLSLRLKQWRENKLWIGAGLNYGFMVAAKAVYTRTFYAHGDYVNESNYSYDPKIGLIQANAKNPAAHKYINLYAFDTGLKTQITYTWKDKYVVRAFYNYSLYDASAIYSQKTGNPVLHQHNTGLTLGVIF